MTCCRFLAVDVPRVRFSPDRVSLDDAIMARELEGCVAAFREGVGTDASPPFSSATVKTF